jgi:hypothetical protein
MMGTGVCYGGRALLTALLYYRVRFGATAACRAAGLLAVLYLAPRV